MNIFPTREALPVLDCATLEPWLREKGLVWQNRPAIILEAWKEEPTRTPQEKKLAERFAPRSMVVEQIKPDQSTHQHFVINEGRGTLTFFLIPESGTNSYLVPLIAEPKSWGISIMPPGGMINKDETPEASALREFTEETGINVLRFLTKGKALISLAGGKPTPYHRRLGERGSGAYWFTGVIAKAFFEKPKGHDLAFPFLMTLKNWELFCAEGGTEHAVVEACGPAITYLAIMALKPHIVNF